MKRLCFALLLALCATSSPLIADTFDPEPADPGFEGGQVGGDVSELFGDSAWFGRYRPHVGYRYQAGDTIGRIGGLSSFDAFFPVLEGDDSDWLMFIDARLLLEETDRDEVRRTADQGAHASYGRRIGDGQDASGVRIVLLGKGTEQNRDQDCCGRGVAYPHRQHQRRHHERHPNANRGATYQSHRHQRTGHATIEPVPGHGPRDEEAADEQEDQWVGVRGERCAAICDADDDHGRRDQERGHGDRHDLGDPRDDNGREHGGQMLRARLEAEGGKPRHYKECRSKDETYLAPIENAHPRAI